MSNPMKPETGTIAPQAPEPPAPVLANVARNVLFQKVTQEQILASLPPDMDHQQFAALFLDALAAMVAQNPKCEERLAQNPGLIARAAQRTAALGAIPGRGAKEVALIYRNGYRKNDGSGFVPDSIDVMPEWRLYMRKMRGAAGVVDIETVLVHSSDTFSYRNGVLVHEFDPFAAGRTFIHPKLAGQGDNGLRGVYTVATMDDGRKKYHFTTTAKIEASRKCSKGPDAGPWLDWYPEMVRKAGMRDAAAAQFVAWSPLQVDEINRIMAADDAAQENQPDRGGYNAGAVADLNAAAGAKPAGMDRLRAALGHQPTVNIDYHTATTPERETIHVQTEPRNGKSAAVDPAERCPVCSEHFPELKGQMDTEIGCPKCEGKPTK